MSENSTARLTNGAVIAAVYMIILVIVLYVPLLNLLALFFLPLPFIIYTYRFNTKAAAFVGIVCLGLTLILTPLPAVFFTVTAVSVGLVMGHLYVKREAPFLPVLLGMVTYIANFVFMLVVSLLILNVNMIDIFEQSIQDSLAATEQTTAWLQLPLDEELSEHYETMLNRMAMMVPAIFLLSALFMALMHHAASRPVLSRLGMSIRSLPPFRTWSMPRSLLFYYLLTLIFILVGVEEGGAVSMIVYNVHFVLEILMLVQGLTLVAHFAYVKKWSKVIPVLAAVFALIPIFSAVIRILGILDLGLDLKKKLNQNTRG